MIFYFSGTGNSLYAAKAVAEAQKDSLISIAQEMEKKPGERVYQFEKGELLGFVYPVYAWGPPEIVLEFIRSMQITGSGVYAFSLSTCGSEEGNAARMLEKELLSKNIPLAAAFSIKMPSNYIVGADIESEEEQQDKFHMAEQRLVQINKIIECRQSGVFEQLKGSMPAFKTTVINPLFNAFARNTKAFSVTDACVHCGLCEEICPVHSITLKDKPVWGKACTQCLGCINRCPVHAIQYGTATLKRGRYVHPDLMK